MSRRTTQIPKSPVSGAPLFVFFAFRTSRNTYPAHSRKERKETIARATQRYADLLEQSLWRHPWSGIISTVHWN